MKALEVHTLGELPEFREVSQKAPDAGQVQMRVAACALNFADLLMIEGRYQETPDLPFIIGMEVAGTVTTIGPSVTDFRIGDRVAAYCGHGGLCESVTTHQNRCVQLPPEIPFDVAASLQIAYGTSHIALAHRANLRARETLVVLGAASGVGLSAIDIGQAMGAKVIAVARGPERLAKAQAAGAHHLLDSDTTDLRDAIKALGGADVVYDAIGGPQSNAVFRATNPEGRILLIGFASGTLPSLKPNHMLVKNISVIGVNWGGYMQFAPDTLGSSLKTILNWYQIGKISPNVAKTLPFAQALDGLALLKSRKVSGKIVITF